MQTERKKEKIQRLEFGFANKSYNTCIMEMVLHIRSLLGRHIHSTVKERKNYGRYFCVISGHR